MGIEDKDEGRDEAGLEVGRAYLGPPGAHPEIHDRWFGVGSAEPAELEGTRGGHARPFGVEDAWRHREPDGLAEHIARRDRRDEPGPWISHDRWRRAAEREAESARTPPSRLYLDGWVVDGEPARHQFNAVALTVGEEYEVRVGVGSLESVPRPGCVRCGNPVRWEDIRVDIGVDTARDGGRAFAVGFRTLDVWHPRCRRRSQREQCRATWKSAPVVARGLARGLALGFVEGFGHLAAGLVEATAPVVAGLVEEAAPVVEGIGNAVAGLVEATAPVVVTSCRDARTYFRSTARRFRGPWTRSGKVRG